MGCSKGRRNSFRSLARISLKLDVPQPSPYPRPCQNNMNLRRGRIPNENCVPRFRLLTTNSPWLMMSIPMRTSALPPSSASRTGSQKSAISGKVRLTTYSDASVSPAAVFTLTLLRTSSCRSRTTSLETAEMVAPVSHIARYSGDGPRRGTTLSTRQFESRALTLVSYCQAFRPFPSGTAATTETSRENLSSPCMPLCQALQAVR